MTIGDRDSPESGVTGSPARTGRRWHAPTSVKIHHHWNTGAAALSVPYLGTGSALARRSISWLLFILLFRRFSFPTHPMFFDALIPTILSDFPNWRKLRVPERLEFYFGQLWQLSSSSAKFGVHWWFNRLIIVRCHCLISFWHIGNELLMIYNCRMNCSRAVALCIVRFSLVYPVWRICRSAGRHRLPKVFVSYTMLLVQRQ